MNHPPSILVLDTIAYPGGSKVATRNILNAIPDKRAKVTVVTSDPNSWQGDSIDCSTLWEPRFLARQEQGVLYFLRHTLLLLSLLWARIRNGPFKVAIGASGPGVDLALYLAQPLLGYRLFQLIHGPVARSRTIGRCLLRADKVYYLESTRESLLQALAALLDPQQLNPKPSESLMESSQFEIMLNGLPRSAWPTPCQYHTPRLFWAASLLQWKGLDLLLDTLRHYFSDTQRPPATLCYIRPRETVQATIPAPQTIPGVSWHEAPENLDQLRAEGNIFISTSQQEPFGLSILEALAAGQCLLIPHDGAYWDRMLVDQVHCIKYRPNDAEDLATKLEFLLNDSEQIKQIGEAGQRIAHSYRADRVYGAMVRTLLSTIEEQTTTAPILSPDT